jgi:hypothetical protein
MNRLVRTEKKAADARKSLQARLGAFEELDVFDPLAKPITDPLDPARKERHLMYASEDASKLERAKRLLVTLGKVMLRCEENMFHSEAFLAVQASSMYLETLKLMDRLERRTESKK